MFKKFFGLLIGLLSVVAGVAPATTVSASAADVTAGCTAIDDLHNDPSFDETLYPAIADDYSMDVITIAESGNGELFVYVYQPSEKKAASSINLSTAPDNVSSYFNLPLTLLSSVGVFQKYKVEGLALLCTETRVYEISSIFRPFDSRVDDPPSDESQTITEVSFPVGKRFEITNGALSVTDIELISVTDQYVGFTRFYSSSFWGTDKCDVHFVAFSTDKRMDDLLEADVYYQKQHYEHEYRRLTNGSGTVTKDDTTYSDVNDGYAYLKKGKDLTWDGLTGFWTWTTYNFASILTAQAFIESEEFSNSYEVGPFYNKTYGNLLTESVENISSKDWVIRFAITDYYIAQNNNRDYTETIEKRDIVGNVTILRLMFETDGVIYNLGVVDNKQSGDLDPDNEVHSEWGLVWWVWLIIAIVALILLWPILKFLWKIISAPFKLIDLLSKKGKTRKESRRKRKR